MLNKIGPAISGVIGAPTNWKSIQKCLKKFDGKNCANAVATLMISSICLKDGVGCGMYVYQSLNNDKIPEKRRKFVAALDLTNGGLMIATQILAFFGMKKLNEGLLYKCFGKTFDKTGHALKTLTEKVRVYQKLDNVVPPTKKGVIAEKHEELKKFCLESIGNITNLVAATILAKRIIVPFIATPLASKVEKMMNEHDAKNKAQEEEKPSVSMKGNSQEQEPVVVEEPVSTNLLDKYRK
ncbi:hypothetical protein J6G99_03530 [bacterium]|nr:hypothetical protein [bacterium]